MRKYGLNIPDDIEVQVHQDSANQKHMVIANENLYDSPIQKSYLHAVANDDHRQSLKDDPAGYLRSFQCIGDKCHAINVVEQEDDGSVPVLLSHDQGSSEMSNKDLESVSGGSGASAACNIGGGIQGAICAGTGILTTGTSAIASLVTVGGTTVASAVGS